MVIQNDENKNPCDTCLTGWAHCDKNGCVSCGDTCQRYKNYIEKNTNNIIENIFKRVRKDA